MKHFIATLIQGSLDYIWKGLYICLTACLELGIEQGRKVCKTTGFRSLPKQSSF